MITKALIIDEPWISKILNGEKIWEMRSTKASLRGPFGLIRKGSGQVVGVASLAGVSGPHTKAQIAEHFEKHQVGNHIVEQPGYKWDIAWHLENVSRLAEPVPYVHKNGAVTWVELDDAAVTAIVRLTQGDLAAADVPAPGSRQVSENTTYRFEASIVRSDEGKTVLAVAVSDTQKVSPIEANKPNGQYVPISRDGTMFLPNLMNSNGLFTCGEKGEERKFKNYDDALNFLKQMSTAKWRRPNQKGNWGIVSAVDWVVAN